METANWPPEHSAALRDLRARGMSYADITRTINARFKTSYTRNATLGRAQRLGLGALIGPEPAVRERSVPEPLRAQTSPNRSPGDDSQPCAGVLHVPKRFFSTRKAPRLRCVEVMPRRCGLAELEANDCRYPYGGDAEGEPITFCGHPRRPGTSYCTPHFHLCRDPEASLQPVLTAAWLELITR
jgi:GcrA cell cycle regulator